MDDAIILALASEARSCSAALHLPGEASGAAPRRILKVADRANVQRTGSEGESAFAPHSAQLLPSLVADALAEGGIRASQVAVVATGIGPASFTSLRLALAVAQGLAAGAGARAIGIGHLEAIAMACGRRWMQQQDAAAGAGGDRHGVDRHVAAAHGVEPVVLVAEDARAGECFHAAWRWTRDGRLEPLLPAALGPARAVLDAFESCVDAQDTGAAASEAAAGAVDVSVLHAPVLHAPVLFCGNGFDAHALLRDWAGQHGADAAMAARIRPDAAAILDAALNAAPERRVAPEDLRPVYLRDRIALDLDEQRALRARPRLELKWRPMKTDDVPEVFRIETTIYPFPWTEGNFRDAIDAGYQAHAYADRDGRLAAYAVTMDVVDEIHLLNLSVRADLQRQGVGSSVLRHLSTGQKERGMHAMLLEVRPSNTTAIRVYDRLGFVSIGRRKGYYPSHGGQREDAIVMRRQLPMAAARDKVDVQPPIPHAR